MFAKLLEHAIAERRRDGRQLAVLFVDLDRFKTSTTRSVMKRATCC